MKTLIMSDEHYIQYLPIPTSIIFNLDAYMDLKIISGVTLLSIILIVVALLIPETKTTETHGLPWQIEQLEGSTRVFGLTLGNSTLSDAESLFLGDSEISLFQSQQGVHTLEAYFDKIELGGLTAKMILILDIPADELSMMFQRGVRISKVGSGSNKVSIATEDLHQARKASIASITYLPAVNLDAKQLESRFGMPEKRVMEPDSTAEHWLYPALGLDVTLNKEEKEILQYVNPADFLQISQPLEATK